MSDQYHYKMEESEAGEYPLYKGDVYYGDILLFDNAKDLMRALTQVRKEVAAGPDLIVFPGDKIDFTNELGTVSRRVIVKAGPEQSSAQAEAPADRNAVLEEVATMLLNGRFLHDQAPPKLFAEEAAKAIREMKRPPVDAPEVDLSYEVIQDDQPVAGASGPTALAEARNFAAQYAQDGPVEIVEVRRKVIDKLEKS